MKNTTLSLTQCDYFASQYEHPGASCTLMPGGDDSTNELDTSYDAWNRMA